jgi:O-antigen ligase
VQRDTVLRAIAAGLVAAFILAAIDVGSRMALSDALFRLVGSPKDINMLVSGRIKPSASVSALLGLLAFGVCVHRRRFGLAAAVAVASIGLTVLSHSMAATLGLLVGGVVAAAGLIHRRLGTAVAAGLIIVLFAGAPVLRALPPSDVLLRLYPGLPNSANHRAMIWTFVAEKVAERPVLGWGLDSSREVGGQETRELWTRADQNTLVPMQQSVLPLHPHNFVLQIWLETGAVGAGLVAGLLLALLALATRLPDWVRLICESTLAASIAVALVSFGIWQSWWLSSLWLIAVLAVALCRPPGRAPVL